MADFDFIDASVQIRQAGAPASDIGRTLLLQHAPAQPTLTDAESIRKQLGFRVYMSAAAFEQDVSDEGLRGAATAYFSQIPYPKALVLGYRQAVAHNHIAVGSTPDTASAIEALGDDVTLTVDGTAIANFDLDAKNTYADQATEIATKINADSRYTGVTCTYDTTNRAFILVSPASWGTGFSGALAEALGLDTAEVYPLVGASEPAGSALSRLDNRGADFGWVLPSDDIVNSTDATTDLTAMANWVSSRQGRQMIFDVFGNDVLSPNESTTTAAQISLLKQNNVAAIYNGATLQHAAAAYIAIFSGINFNGVNTLRSGANKVLQGIRSVELTSTQKEELRRKRINYYEKTGQVSLTREGWSFGTWIDAAYLANWIRNTAQGEILNAMTSGEIKQIDGDDQVLQAISSVLNTAVANGGIRSGTASAQMIADIRSRTGDSDLSDFLPRGYYVWRPSYSTQLQADRDARKSVPHYVWMLGSGFVNSVEFSGVFEP